MRMKIIIHIRYLVRRRLRLGDKRSLELKVEVGFVLFRFVGLPLFRLAQTVAGLWDEGGVESGPGRQVP